MKKPLRKRCKTCATLVPVAEYEDHMFCHEAQLPMFDESEVPVVERVKRPRKRVEGLA